MADGYKAFTQDWMDQWKAQMTGSALYKETAKEWEGSVSVTVNADAAYNVPEPIHMFTDYWHGEVRDFYICDAEKAKTAKFAMSGEYPRWKQVAKKELDATKALMQGKLKLVGDLTYIVKNIKTINLVVDLLTHVNTIFPDDVKTEAAAPVAAPVAAAPAAAAPVAPAAAPVTPAAPAAPAASEATAVGYKAFTQEWMDQWKAQMTGSALYKETAKEWEGSVSVTVNADPAYNVPVPIHMFTDYWHGEVRDFYICDAEKAKTAKFAMSGEYPRWKQVAKKELDATKALMQGKLKLVGDLTYIVKNIKTINLVVDLLTHVNTIFPDDVK